ncbi:MAG: hypothetical protein RJA36_801 [Pseudomonadota bacterium]|jgi:predicted RNase H-like nuclease
MHKMARRYDEFANGRVFRFTTQHGQKDVKAEDLFDALLETVAALRTAGVPRERWAKAAEMLAMPVKVGR